MAGAALIAPAQPITPQTSAIRDRPLPALSADTSCERRVSGAIECTGELDNERGTTS